MTAVPDRMRAAVYSEYGPPDVLSVHEVPVPTPAEGEVLVQVVASSVNDWDYHLLTGEPFVNRMSGLREPRFPVLGADVAGRVVALGPGTSGLTVGDEVMGDVSGAGFGAFAEYVSAPGTALVAKPASVTFEQAAALPQAGGLALAALRYGRRVQAGDRVLVNGAGGGVGTIATQAAVALGAHVTGVDAPHKLAGVRAAGAEEVIDYTREDAFTSGERYDRIVDVTSRRPLRAYRRALRPRGVAAIIGGSIPRVFFALAVGPVTPLAGGRRLGVPLWSANDEGDTEFLLRLVDTGAVRPVLDSVYPLDRISDAFARFDASEHVGKIVVTIGS